MGEHPDEHAPSINALRRAGDWAGLVRYWLGHALHQPALDEAIALLRKQKVRRAGDWAGLVRYWLGRALHQPAPDAAIAILQKQRDRKHVARLVKLLTAVSKSPWNLPDELFAALLQETEGAEQATLQMVALFPQTALCKMANDLPPELREEVLQAGIEAADQIVTLGHSLGDLPIQAGFCLLEAYGYRSAGQLDRAEKSFTEALEHYQELLAAHPNSGTAKTAVAMTLNSLGTAQSALGRPEAAGKSYIEALRLRRALLAAHPDSETAKVAVAGTLNNLGTAQRALGRLEAAEKSLTDALEHYQELLVAHSGSESAKDHVAMALNNLGLAQHDLGRLEVAEESYTEALRLYQELLAAHPNSETAKADVAMTLNNLGTAQHDL